MRVIKIFLCISLLAGVITQSCVLAADPDDIFEKQRLKMVNEQLRGRDIDDPDVLSAMTEVPSHLFVTEGIGAEVFTIEIVTALGNQAKTLLNQLGYDKVRVKIGDGYLGWPEYAPFNGIIVTCAPTRIPEPLKEQLAEGGRMVIPVGGSGFRQLFLLTQKNGRIIQEKIIDVRFVPMVDEKGKTY